MQIRRATEKDVPDVTRLLKQVLTIHADLRPDIFVHGTTKYTAGELVSIFQNEQTPVFVAVDAGDAVLGYAFCVIRDLPATNNTLARRQLYVDDLCVDEALRGSHIGEALYRHVQSEAEALDCDSITLNVWEGNDSARHFYEKMGLTPRNTTMEQRIQKG